MSKKFVVVMLFAATIGLGLCLGMTPSHAASIAQMQANVSADTGAIYSEELGRDMTKDEAKLYFDTVHQEQSKLGLPADQVPENVDKAARQAVEKSTKEAKGADQVVVKHVKADKKADSPVVKHLKADKKVTKTLLSQKNGQPLSGTSIPTDAKTLNGETYKSEPFSGDGWRYSGYYFQYKDYVANPSFGVRVNNDSFNFITRRNTAKIGSYVVQPDGKFHYYPSTNAGNLNGYFSTLDPVGGSYYEIN
ncbi:MAG: hypothetical protein LBT37_05045 [Lactobacillaceae bacterium]|nr:hypothetical protein [Lactobacillaceae bacterium]